MVKVEVTVENRPACHPGQYMWIYTTSRTYKYKYYVQVPIVLLHKTRSAICLVASAFLTAEENMNQRNEIMEPRGTHFTVASFCSITLEDIAETH